MWYLLSYYLFKNSNCLYALICLHNIYMQAFVQVIISCLCLIYYYMQNKTNKLQDQSYFLVTVTENRITWITGMSSEQRIVNRHVNVNGCVVCVSLSSVYCPCTICDTRYYKHSCQCTNGQIDHLIQLFNMISLHMVRNVFMINKRK